MRLISSRYDLTAEYISSYETTYDLGRSGGRRSSSVGYIIAECIVDLVTDSAYSWYRTRIQSLYHLFFR